MKKMFLFLAVSVFVNGALPIVIEKELKSLAAERDVKGLQESLDELLKEGFIERSGADGELRPIFVTIQGMVESSLAAMLGKNVVDQFRGAIHTPAPATPLCTVETIEEPLAKKTIKDRTVTLRELLSHGGKLLIIYPEGGLEKRSEEQRKIYLETVGHYKNIFDCPIKGTVENPFIGATYLFVDPKNGKTYLFSIETTKVKEEMLWKLWLDELDSSFSKERLRQIEMFIQENASCTLRDFDLKLGKNVIKKV
jgi:hypothetical protein